MKITVMGLGYIGPVSYTHLDVYKRQVSGSAIAEPKNLEVRIGTQVEKLIDACGGFKEAPNKLLMGGPVSYTHLMTKNEALGYFGSMDIFCLGPVI